MPGPNTNGFASQWNIGFTNYMNHNSISEANPTSCVMHGLSFRERQILSYFFNIRGWY